MGNPRNSKFHLSECFLLGFFRALLSIIITKSCMIERTTRFHEKKENKRGKRWQQRKWKKAKTSPDSRFFSFLLLLSQSPGACSPRNSRSTTGTELGGIGPNSVMTAVMNSAGQTSTCCFSFFFHLKKRESGGVEEEEKRVSFWIPLSPSPVKKKKNRTHRDVEQGKVGRARGPGRVPCVELAKLAAAAVDV